MTRALAALGGLVLAACAVLAPVPAALAATPAPAAPTAPTAPTAPASPASPAAPATSAAPASPGACPDGPISQPSDPPVLAHFYIWFTASSWNRAKKDYPSIGRYSSDSVEVMQEQVAQARAAGIDGFIVSWKSSSALNRRLKALRDVAASNDFKLAITYQAQDFNRRPLPVDRVRQDLETLADTYADDPVFQLFGTRPVVAISGTWHYSQEELQSITAPVASRLRVLATEKSVGGYERVAPAVEGELYYWSSADPQQTPHYLSKLVDMGNAVRARCGVWVAPVAPGFDARDVGGHSVVERRDGATLRASWQAALATTPDAIGVISWNEFSENTYIEPSERYGRSFLDSVADLVHAPLPPPKELDSTAADGDASGTTLRPALSAAAALAAVLGVTVWGHRRRRAGRL